MVPYHKEYRIVTKTVQGALLWRKLEELFSQSGTDVINVSSTDWQDLLGFSPAEFRSAFQKIGTIYKSRSEFVRANGDKFKNKMYCYYYDRRLRQIVIHRNERKVRDMLKKVGRQTVTATVVSIDVSQKQKTKPAGVPRGFYQSIVDLYNDILGKQLPAVKYLSDKRTRLLRTMTKHFSELQNLNGWQAYFEKVKQSGFLMGEKTDWKANFDFLIKKNNYIKVIEGFYENNGVSERNKRVYKNVVNSWMGGVINDNDENSY